ncbi:hypothetical protein DFO67_10422 [Modicisalibacter xianhensis]|uniref:Terminase-like family protein n=1 Tax=Modicisalibacter xianhensis TaxID=442341 RepID=A0A4R8FW19_9GAMM|nr:terminase [Halomonas xianhensis]TDX30767.1 hypothetical protein DFO67_10422 [Halomonas xianhensis]
MNKVVEIGYRPHFFQNKLHQAIRRFSVVVAHRRFGKTVYAVNTLIAAALRCTKKNPQFAYIAPYRNQAKAIAWKEIKKYTQMIPGIEYSEADLKVIFPHNNAEIRLYGADNPDALRGIYLDGCVLDEVADMRPEVWGEVVRPALADRKGWALFIGTPKGINMFSELYFHALETPGWYAAIFRASETGIIDDEELEAMKQTMTESQIAQELECDFSAAVDNVLINVNQVQAAAGKHLDETEFHRAPRILGVDVARYGDDRSVIIKRQGLAAFEPKIMRDVDNMELASIVAKHIDMWKPDATFIDAGRGEGVIDRLRQLGYTIIEVNFGGKPMDDRFSNKRSEMWSDMADWLKAGGAIPNHQELKTDLCVPTFSYKNAQGKFALESKDSIKDRGMKSPDVADALALTFAFPVAPKDYDSMRGNSHVAETEFDPWG